MLTKKEIIQAGEDLRNGNVTDQTKNVVNDWRRDHAYPLQHLYVSLNRAHKGKGIVVSQRLKRFSSIQQKLQRMDSLSLWRMQDIGGCRVIVPNLDDLKVAIEKELPMTFVKKREKNYINSPKISGYRSVHHIYSYEKKDKYHGILLEVQYRTELQHIWATAVEMMSVGESNNVKASEADQNILKFFADVASLFAMEEKAPLVPGTPTDRRKLLNEILDLNIEMKVLSYLEAKKIVCRNAAEKEDYQKKGLFLLCLDFTKQELKVSYYEKIKDAVNAYNIAENDPAVNAVLVKAGALKRMRLSYPNYFMDVSNFVRTVRALVMP